MISRLNKRENSRFWGCSNYPKCKGTRDSDGLSYKDKHPDDNEQENDTSDDAKLSDEEIRLKWNRR